MTRKELVDALTENFAEDEEITFLHMDEEYGALTFTEVEVQDYTEFHHKGHWEYLENGTGEWIPTTVSELQKDEEKQKRVSARRWVPEGELSVEKKKVLRICW